MSHQDRVGRALEQLDARSWAQLLRALRAIDGPSDALATALAAPTSALASGPARRMLAEAAAADAALLERLRADDSLPTDVHEALAVPAGGEREDGDAREVREEQSEEASGRAADRSRTLRRSLEEERRRRQGAEARADAAEARADATEASASASTARIDALEAALADAEEALRRAVGRAERRADARIAALEAELTATRAAAEARRIDLERVRAELAVTRAERPELEAQDVGPARSTDVAGARRPLVLPSELAQGTTEAARWLAERATVVLVDGYNAVLALHPGRTLEEQRRWLVDRLRPLVARGGSRPVVVFDGAGVNGRLRDTGGVEVRFTAAGASADDEIVFMVAATDEPVLVITDDVELQARVRAEGGDVVATVHLLGIVG